MNARHDPPRPVRAVRLACMPGLLVAHLLTGSGERDPLGSGARDPIAPAAENATRGVQPAGWPPGASAAVPRAGSPPDASLAVPPAAPAPVQDAATILARAADRHRSLRTLRTSFTQRIRNPVLERDETSTGVFYYRSPLRYRIAFATPPEDVVVSDGSRVWIYLPSSQPGQVIRSPVEGARGFAPYQFLDEFGDHYEAALVGKEPVGGRSTWHLVLTPVSPEASYARAELWVDAESSLTRAMEVEESNGVVRRFTLEDHRLDAPLADSLFGFRPPRGVEVFDR